MEMIDWAVVLIGCGGMLLTAVVVWVARDIIDWWVER